MKPRLAIFRLLAQLHRCSERGWLPDNLRANAITGASRIAADANAFLASLVDREAVGEPIALMDGTRVARLPVIGDGCGRRILRQYRVGSAERRRCLHCRDISAPVPETTSRYATVRWADVVEASGRLRYVEITTQPDNVASAASHHGERRCVIEEFVPTARWPA
jgi:hypothetical protein